MILLAVSCAPGTDSGYECRRLCCSIFPGKLPDSIRRYAGDRLRPFRGLGHSVFIAQNVIFERIEPDGEFIQECLFLQVLRHHYVGHCDERGGIRAGADRYPVMGECRGGGSESGVDGDDLGAMFFGLRQIPGSVGVLNSDRRVPSPHDYQFGIEEVIAGVGGESHPETGELCKDAAFVGVQAPGARVSAHHAEYPAHSSPSIV
ncbi:hypothetical protein ES703_104327 [subsurface metagenome]